ncbi:hypothetical protein [Rhodohalobacter sp. 8-1]|uniref:hypothetical protein n=1 Tax=Rhodohalobacter sp. 8-1 TaxID=3131972 RepID=UPI0030EE1EF6
MTRLFYILLIFLVACEENTGLSGNTIEDPHEYYEFYTTDFSYVAVLTFENFDAIENGCKIELDLYESPKSFRIDMNDKYTAGEFVPYMGLDSRYDDFELNLSEMTKRRSIQLIDRIRPVECVSDKPEDAYQTELKHFWWAEGLESRLGYSGHVINRSDTAFVYTIRHESLMFHIW